MYEYENMRRIVYRDYDIGDAVFVPVCEKCGRFVKPDKTIQASEDTGLKDQPNATCSKCGRVEMLFEGFF
jgi:RNase P subunit RPR2